MANTFKRYIYFISVLVLLTACQSPKDKMSKQITTLEDELSTEYNTKKMDSLVVLYKEYIKEFPQDSMVAEYLFRSGTINMTLRKGPEALSDFTTLINKFPKSQHLPEAYYYKAFVYEDIMYDIMSARTAYYDFINRYPTHKLVTDATLSIQYLGKSPEEIIASFEQKENASKPEE